MSATSWLSAISLNKTMSIDQVLEFSWEPLGDRFAIVHSSDPNLAAGPAPGITIKTDISFYGHDKTKGDFRLLSTCLIVWN